jgi:hypothetical protein
MSKSGIYCIRNKVNNKSEQYKQNITGEGNLNAKLTTEIVKKIKTDLNNNERCCDICKKYNISESQIYRIKNNLQWEYVEAG